LRLLTSRPDACNRADGQGDAWRNADKLCMFAAALRADSTAPYALLLDAHDTWLQQPPSRALAALRHDKRIVVEDEAITKTKPSSYAQGLRWVDARLHNSVRLLRDGTLRRNFRTPDPKANFDLGVACGQPGFKHNTGALMGPRLLLVDLLDAVIASHRNETSDQRALGLLVASDPERWCPQLHLSRALAFLHTHPGARRSTWRTRCGMLHVGSAVPIAVHVTGSGTHCNAFRNRLLSDATHSVSRPCRAAGARWRRREVPGRAGAEATFSPVNPVL
jgi:hypothetical protein